jgi:hypothetical protein
MMQTAQDVLNCDPTIEAVDVSGAAAKGVASASAQEFLDFEWLAFQPCFAAVSRYDLGNGEFLQWLADRDIAPYMRTRDSIHRKGKWLVMSIRIYG